MITLKPKVFSLLGGGGGFRILSFKFERYHADNWEYYYRTQYWCCFGVPWHCRLCFAYTFLIFCTPFTLITFWTTSSFDSLHLPTQLQLLNCTFTIIFILLPFVQFSHVIIWCINLLVIKHPSIQHWRKSAWCATYSIVLGKSGLVFYMAKLKMRYLVVSSFLRFLFLNYWYMNASVIDFITWNLRLQDELHATALFFLFQNRE